MEVNHHKEFGMTPRNKFRLLVPGIVIFILTACIFSNNGEATETPMVEQTNAPTNEPIEIDTATNQVELSVSIFLVAIEDKGISGKKIGCDDSLIPVEIKTSSNFPAPWNALQALLSFDQTYYGDSGLYNALHQSKLEIQSYEVKNGKAKVYLQGELMLGGTCDNPRVEEQIMGTILQAEELEEVEVYVNGVLLQEALSLK